MLSAVAPTPTPPYAAASPSSVQPPWSRLLTVAYRNSFRLMTAQWPSRRLCDRIAVTASGESCDFAGEYMPRCDQIRSSCRNSFHRRARPSTCGRCRFVAKVRCRLSAAQFSLVGATGACSRRRYFPVSMRRRSAGKFGPPRHDADECRRRLSIDWAAFAAQKSVGGADVSHRLHDGGDPANENEEACR